MGCSGISFSYIVFTSKTLSVQVKLQVKRFAEVAGCTTAECTAICCCCPCGITDLLFLAVYKVPAGLCRKALRSKRRRRLMEKGLLPRAQSRYVITRVLVYVIKFTGDLVTVSPDVFQVDLGVDAEFVLLASDGLWDYMNSSEAVSFVREQLRKHGDAQIIAFVKQFGLQISLEKMARSWSLEGSVKLKNLFGYGDLWDGSLIYGWDQMSEVSAGVSLPRFNGLVTRMMARVSLLSQDWLKFSSYKEQSLGLSLGLISATNHDVAYNLS